MYERSAIVLERYFENFLGFDKTNNIKNIRSLYEKLIKEVELCQDAVQTEEKIINTFDEAASKIQRVQKAQTQIYNKKSRLEEIRNQLFGEIGENKEKTLEKLEKLEKDLLDYEEKIKILKDEYIENLGIFLESQEQRSVQTKKRRAIENTQLELVKQSEEEIKGIDSGEIKLIKEFSVDKYKDLSSEIEQLMIENGKNEPIGFNILVIRNSVKERISIAKEEARAYILVLERLKRVLAELNTQSVTVEKYQKIARDISAKLNFLEAKKGYIVGFLDNERVTVISGQDVHDKIMEQSTKEFTTDIIQINNLYELILREVANKSSKKAYDELYNQTYLQEIENNEQNIKDEINNISIQTAVISSNYWRTYGVKNVYAVFKEEVIAKFEKDMSEYEEKDEYLYEEENLDSYEKYNSKDLIQIEEKKDDDIDYEFEKDEYDEVEEKDTEELCEEAILDDDDLEENFDDLVELSDLEEDEEEKEQAAEEEIDLDLEEDIDLDLEEDDNDFYDYEEEEEDDDDDYEEEEDDDEDEDEDEDDYEEDDENGKKGKKLFDKMFGEKRNIKAKNKGKRKK